MGAARVELVRARNPGPLTGPGTNTWLYGLGEAVVIDPGPATPSHLDAVMAAASAIGPVAMIVVTHHHQDHAEGARQLSALTGAPLALFHTEVSAPGDLGLHHHDRILAGGAELMVLHTPGHAADHVCLFEEPRRLLFSGDHVLSGTTSVIWPPDGNMDQYLASLQLVIDSAPHRILPGHGEPIEDPDRALAELLSHRLAREQQIFELLKAGPARPRDIVTALYATYPQAVWEAAEKTVLAHLLRLEASGRVRRSTRADDSPFEVLA